MKIITIHSPKTSDKLSSNYKQRNRDKMVRFLPSIAYYRTNDQTGDVMYIMAYRVWRGETLPAGPLTRPSGKGHPWYEWWGSSVFDGTAFSMLNVSKDATKVIVTKDTISNRGNGKIDMRLLHIKDNKYYATFNTFGRMNPLKYPRDVKKMNIGMIPKCFYYIDKKTGLVDYNPSSKKIYSQATTNNGIQQGKHYLDHNGCTFQNSAIVTIDVGKTELTPTIRNASLVCPEFHRRVEKNYAMFYDNRGRLSYQYAIYPWSFLDHACKRRVPMKTSLFKRVADYYDPYEPSPFNKSIVFSCSTPLIRFNDTEYIAIGHFKLRYDNIYKFPSKSPARKFTNQLKKALRISSFDYNKHTTKLHPELVYGMFVYTVNRTTLKLQRASKCFVLMDRKHPTALCFPSGIVKHSEDKFITSYHENDMTLKLWVSSRDELEAMLVFDETKQQQPVEASRYPFDVIHV